MDWTFTPTSLDLFQWFKFDDIYSKFHLSKCDKLYLENRKVGSLVKRFFKIFMGFFGLMLILTLLLGPLIIFSSLNPSAQSNPVT